MVGYLGPAHGMKWFVTASKKIDGRKEWVWNVKGKGGKEAMVTVNDALLAALARYRVFLGLPPFPATDEKTPMLLDQSQKRGIGERQISRLVQEIFLLAADNLYFRKIQYLPQKKQMTCVNCWGCVI